MCGRVRSTIQPSDIRNILSNVLYNSEIREPAIDPSTDVNINENIINSVEELSPGMEMNVAFIDDKKCLQVKPMTWGISINKMCLFNTQVENLSEKPMFWKLTTHNRGVILVDGFYEWKSNGKGKPKTKYFVTPSESDYFVFPVIFNNKDKFTILTRDPLTEAIRNLHHRQPIMLSYIQIKIWVNKTKPEHTETAWISIQN